MSDWSVNDIIEFLRLYKVPKHAIAFILKHNIDGTTMDESVEFIVKDLLLTSVEDEETILNRWKNISCNNLSPADVIYGKIIEKSVLPVHQQAPCSETVLNHKDPLSDNNAENEYCSNGYVRDFETGQYTNTKTNGQHSNIVLSDISKTLNVHDNNNNTHESILDETEVPVTVSSADGIQTTEQQQQLYEQNEESKNTNIIPDATDDYLPSPRASNSVHNTNSSSSLHDVKKINKDLAMQSELLHIQKERIRLQEELIQRQRVQLQNLTITSHMNPASSTSNYNTNSKQQSDQHVHTKLSHTQHTNIALSEQSHRPTSSSLYATADDTTQLRYEAHWEAPAPATLLHDSISMLSGSDLYEQNSQEEEQHYHVHQDGTGKYTAAEDEPASHYIAADDSVRERDPEHLRSPPIALTSVGIPIWQPPAVVTATYRAQSAKTRRHEPIRHAGSFHSDRRNTVTGTGYARPKTASDTAATSLPSDQRVVHNAGLLNEASVDSSGMVWHRNKQSSTESARPKTCTTHTRPTAVPRLDLPIITSGLVPHTTTSTTSARENNQHNDDYRDASSRVEDPHMMELTEVIQQLAESNAALTQAMRPITAPSKYHQSALMKKPAVPSRVHRKKPFIIQNTEQHSGNSSTQPSPPLHSVQKLFDTARDEAIWQVVQWSRQQQLQHRDLLLAKADKLLALTSRSEPSRGRTAAAVEPRRPETNHSTRRHQRNGHRTLVPTPTTATNKPAGKVQELISSLAEQYGFTASEPSHPQITSSAVEFATATVHQSHAGDLLSVLSENNNNSSSSPSYTGSRGMPGGAMLLLNTGSGVIRDGPGYASPMTKATRPTPPPPLTSRSSNHARNTRNKTKSKTIRK